MTFVASRSSVRSGSDFDAAMAHSAIGQYADFESVRDAIAHTVLDEGLSLVQNYAGKTGPYTRGLAARGRAMIDAAFQIFNGDALTEPKDDDAVVIDGLRFGYYQHNL